MLSLSLFLDQNAVDGEARLGIAVVWQLSVGIGSSVRLWTRAGSWFVVVRGYQWQLQQLSLQSE